VAGNYTYVANLTGEVEVPENGTLSRTLHNDDRVKVVIFAFAAGQELSAHTAPMPALIQFLEGEMDVTLGADKMEARAGTLIHMPAQTPHALRAKTPAKMVLYLLKNPQ
jgi:quercetin dioxygenase-like cupin family protein